MRALCLLIALGACSPSPRPDGDGSGDDVTPDGNSALACEEAKLQRSYIGCRYWPIDLDNAIDVFGPPVGGTCETYSAEAVVMPALAVCVLADGTFAGRCDPGASCAAAPAGATCEIRDTCGLDAQHSPYAIIVANTGTEAADVTLDDADGTTVTVAVGPGATATLKPQQLGFADHSLDAPGISASAYRLTSTRPIVAYQLNPLDDVGVFSNDASLLLPEQTFDVGYIALSYPNTVRRPATGDWRGYVTLVATEATTVQITPTVDALVGGVTTVPAGQTESFALQAFETLHVEAASGDISGTKVTSDRPIGAYAGHQATSIADPFPFRGPCCADHLEEQLYPTSSWGRTFAIARGRERSTRISDYLRIVARNPNTVVSVQPEADNFSTCTGKLLGPGQLCDVYIHTDVEIRASEPVLVGHYMVSGGGLGPQSGDPAMAFVPPVEQLRESYTIVVPEQYTANDLQLVTPVGGQFLLDGADVSLLLVPFGTGLWGAARVQVTPGKHVIECPMGCSVEVAGWNTAVSYLYSGGLDLSLIVL